jgi:hypothetical protein
MTTTRDTRRDTKPTGNKRTEHLSPDGKWLSYPKVPNLLRYRSTGLYFARTKINGKLIRRGLKAKTFEEANLALHDFLSREQKRRHITGAPVTMGEARGLYESSIENDHTLAPASVTDHKNRLKKLCKSWPGIDKLKPRSITRAQCEQWASALAGEVGAQYFNNILTTFKGILNRAGVADDDSSPLHTVKRMGIALVPPVLPEPEQFLKLVEIMEHSGARQSQDCADFARFLAYSGCRLSEARAATWGDSDMEAGFLTVHSAKMRLGKNRAPTRRVPIIPDMRQLLDRLKRSNPDPAAPLCKVGECEKSLTRACKMVGIPKLTHHDLRHLFATRCIEAGVDIPTVSRWLGHSDGGALAMRVYGHLREQHSAAMAQKVTFSATQPANVLPISQESAI